MRKLFIAFTFVALSGLSAYGTTLTGNFITAEGRPVNGKIELILAPTAGAKQISTNKYVAGGKVIPFAIRNGAIVAPGGATAAVVIGNDDLQPANETYYEFEVKNDIGEVIGANFAVITGSSFDIGAAVLTPISPRSILYKDMTGLSALSVVGGLSTVSFAVTTAGAAQSVVQNGAGDIVDFKDGATSRFKVTKAGVVTIGGGINPDGGGHKHQRVAFNPAAGNVDVIVTWPTTFVNTNYTPVCTVNNGFADTTVMQLIGLSAASITVRITGTGAHVGGATLYCSADHD